MTILLVVVSVLIWLLSATGFIATVVDQYSCYRKAINSVDNSMETFQVSIEDMHNWISEIPPGHLLWTIKGQRYLTWAGSVSSSDKGLVVDSDDIRRILKDPYMKGSTESLISLGENKAINEYHKDHETGMPWDEEQDCPCKTDTCPRKPKPKIETKRTFDYEEDFDEFNRIYRGQVKPIFFNKPRVHKVVEGESLLFIGHHYGIDWKSIASLNKIEFPYVVYPNMMLTLPR